MSQSEKLGTDSSPISDESEKSPNASSRREFLQAAMVGTIGAAVVGGDPLTLFAPQTGRHVDGFIRRAKRVQLNAESTQDFQRVADIILTQIRRDPSSKSAFAEIQSWFFKQKVSTSLSERRGIFDVSEDLSAAAATSFLRAIPELPRFNSVASPMKTRLADSVERVKLVEVDFVNHLISETKKARQVDRAFAQRIDDATNALRQIGSHLSAVGHLEHPKKKSTISAKPDNSHHGVGFYVLQRSDECVADPVCEWCTRSALTNGVCIALIVVVIVVGGKTRD